MGWSGGNYTKGNNATGGWTGDASLGIGIEAGRHDTQDNDFATGINQCLNKDGSNAATGNLNLGGFRPTNIVAGTAADPAVCVGGDTNTGVFGPAADTWAVATNGSERLRISSTGAVGIGATAPSVALQVSGGTINVSGLSSPVTHFAAAGASNNNAGIVAGSLNGNNPYIAASKLGNGTATPLSFYTNDVERARFDTSGSFGIGAAPTGTLDVRSPYVDADDFVVGFPITGNYYVKSKLVSRHTTGSAANVYIDPSNHLLVRSTSSARYKTDIRDYTKGLADVMNLAPKFYKGITDGDKQFAGLIAEEVDAAGLSEFVVYNDDNQPDALHYGNMVALAFKAIQDLNVKVEELEARVATLEA